MPVSVRYGRTFRPCLFSRPGRGWCASIISALGSHHQFAMPFGLGVDSDLAKSTGTLGSGGFVTDRVLIADIVGDGFADGIHFIECLRKEGDSARAVGD